MPLYESLLNRSYFEGEFTIGQLDTQSVQDELNLFIRRYEYDFLTKLMGVPLYEAFYAGMKEAPVDVRWQEMAYGKFFLLDASKVKVGFTNDALGNCRQIPAENYFDKMPVNFRGVLKRDSDTDNESIVNSGYGATSPIVKYVYYKWMKSHNTATGGAGETVQQVQNGDVVSNARKMVWAWNDMCSEVIAFYHFLDMNITTYPEFNLTPDGRFSPVIINEWNLL